jgi:hypothetical protein
LPAKKIEILPQASVAFHAQNWNLNPYKLGRMPMENRGQNMICLYVMRLHTDLTWMLLVVVMVSGNLGRPIVFIHIEE